MGAEAVKKKGYRRELATAGYQAAMRKQKTDEFREVVANSFMEAERGYVDDVFFFQAEDGRRDPLVTGVQTCALPILSADDSWCRQFVAQLVARWQVDVFCLEERRQAVRGLEDSCAGWNSGQGDEEWRNLTHRVKGRSISLLLQV